MEWIRELTTLRKNNVALAGGKGASLGEMTQAGIPVPPGFVILADAFEQFLKESELHAEIDSILHTVHHEEIHTVEHASEKIKALILHAPMPKDLQQSILTAFKKLNVLYVAVRSSATAEDSASAAWAGQLDSYLNTTKEQILEHVKKCWASLFTPRAIFYRFEKELHKEKVSVAVVVQKMVASESSGIAFSVHPVTQDYNQLIIEAGFGLGEAIVSGQITPDSYVVEKKPLRILEKKVHEQKKGLFRADHGGNVWKELGEQGKEQVLKENEILELAKLIMKIEQHYGFPVDVEWAREKDKFYIVQSRPITTLTHQSEQDVVNKFITLLGKDKLIVFEARFLPILVMIDWWNYYDADGKLQNLYPMFGYRNETIDKLYLDLTKYSSCSYETFEGYLHEKLSLREINKHYENEKKHIEILYRKYCNLKEYVLEKDLLHTLKTIDKHLRELAARTLFLDVLDKTIIEEALKKNNIPINLKELFALSQILEFPSFEVKNAEAILQAIEQKRDIMDLQYIYTSYTAVPTKEELREIFNKIVIKDLKDFLKKQRKELEQNSEKKKKLTANLSDIEKKVLHFIDWSTLLRDDRKIVLNKVDALIVNLARSLFRVWGINEHLATLAFVPEILKGKKYIMSKLESIKKREQTFAIIHHGKNVYEESKEAVQENINPLDQKILDQNAKGESSAYTLIGESASPGHAEGKVKVILSIKEFDKFNEGDILVAPMTRPEYVPLMKKAVAIITDEGGITSHAAIVSRELRKPCVIGTRIATKLLKDGDYVQVNATHATVRVLKSSEEKEETKRMVNLQSREHSLVYCYVWQKANQEYSKDFFDKVKNILFINKGFGKTSVWYEEKELNAIFDASGKRATRDKNYFSKVKKEFYNHFNKLLDYFNGKIKIKNSKDLQEYYQTYIHWWSPMAIMYVLPESKTAPEDIRKAALKIRSATEKYSDENDRFFMEQFNRLYPHYSTISHLLTPDEIFQCSKGLKKEQIETIQQREKGYVLYNGRLYTLEELDVVLKKNNLILQEEKVEDVVIIKGQVAFKSDVSVRGRVKVILSKKQLFDFKEGEILVTEMTSPDYLPVFKKALAVITDEGGVNCHAAIVSRELKKPCIIGTKIATKVLKDGMQVEVDADHGLIRILSERNKVDLGNYHDYQRCFQWKGGGLPFLFSDIFMGHYKTLECLITLAHGIWTNFLPKKVVEQTLEEGKKLISNTQLFDSYRTAFEEYKKECITFFEKIIKKHDVSQKELRELLVYFSKLFYYYSKTEFFYVDKAFEHAKTHKETANNLEKFDAIKNKGREYLNNLFLGEKSYFEELLRILSQKFSVPTKDLKSYSRKELLALFDNDKVSKETLEARRVAYVMLPHNGELDGIEGKDAEERINNFLQESHHLHGNTLKGVIANKGKASGKVRIFSYGPEEFDKVQDMIHDMQKGEILVADTTSPELMMACKKAAAIITNQGGLMSHAAIVSRELGIPCIVGLGNVTDVVANGDTVEVDADKGIVKILNKAKEKSNLSKEDINLGEWEFEFQQRNEHPILMADFWCRALYRKFVNEINLSVEPYDYFFTTSSKGYVKIAQKKITLEAINKAFNKDNAYSAYLYNQTIKRVNELEATTKYILGEINKETSNKRLVELWKKFDETFLTLIPWYWIPYYPIEQNLLSDKIKDSLVKYKDKIDKITDFNNAFMILISPTKEMAFKEEQKDFFELVKIAIKKEVFYKDKNFNDEAKEYLKKYSWMNTFILLPIEPLTLNELIKKIKKAIEEKSIETYYLQEKKKAENDEISKKILQMIEKDKKLLETIGDIKKIGWVLTWSVETSLHTLSDLQPFFKLIAKRLGISYSHWIHLTSDEIVQILEEKKGLEEVKLKEREKGYFFLMEKGTQKMVIGEEGKSLSEWVEKNLNSVDENITEFKGQSACSGHVKGKACIALIAKDSYKLKDGEILVCAMTSPDYVPAMKRASAIITDEGGMLSHAAIMSREFGKPCVIATKIATKILKDGDLVEVDANHGYVKIIKKV